ncbi:hypothetical protein STSP2_00076 [Anaerohalosphaera lusitana]|uniref:Uncharacterized protein n=1 Tax=Anaerohalosphaera lusitana TaxID=1936003 RepID=A0A1U9NGQ8_9BACT|nr:hypothetical protein [Anaerohalosphaera lusitana]AQT66938.1 hypothetical protein STSP2_00076 [Anaerohalosphaera lusitana]
MRSVISIAVIAVSLVLTGCAEMEKPVEIRLTEPAKPAQATTERQRFDGATAQQEAQAASQVYTTRILTEENKELRKQIDELTAEKEALMEDNQVLEKRAVLLKENLAQTEKELEEANELLIDMRMELDKWKENVLGYREELRTVHTEQLRALAKILKLMGAEMVQQEQQSEGQ